MRYDVIQEMKTFMILLCATVCAVKANPVEWKGETKISKTWERCLISVSEQSAGVSCAVGYKVDKRISKDLFITVPVFWPKGANYDPEAIAERISPRIECDGVIYEPSGIRDPADIREFESEELDGKCVVINFGFVVRVPDGRDFRLLVTYEQPLIESQAAYYPLFETGAQPFDRKGFTVTFFTSDTSELSLVTLHKGNVESMRSRITVVPNHEELIVVNKTNQDNKSEMATPRKPSD